jgi:hypothetical protein
METGCLKLRTGDRSGNKLGGQMRCRDLVRCQTSQQQAQHQIPSIVPMISLRERNNFRQGVPFERKVHEDYIAHRILPSWQRTNHMTLASSLRKETVS